MKRAILLLLVCSAIAAGAQMTRIVIPAGTPEDQAIQAITDETDAAKRVAMLEQFLQKFAANPQAVAYGNWQLSQQYLTQGDPAKALAAGEKALAVQPDNLDILVSVAGVAQQLNARDKIVAYAVRGAQAFHALQKQPKPADVSEADFNARLAEDLNGARPGYEFLESAALNAIMAEQAASARMAFVEQFMTAFPASRYQEQMMQYAVYTLSQLNDPARLAAFSQKAIASNPNSAPVFAMLASAFAESANPAHAVKAEEYARKAIQLAKADDPAAEKQQRVWAGLAHSALGYALLRQDKFVAGIAELKTASTLVKDDPDSYSTVLYRLGWAYAKANRAAEAKAVLSEAVEVKGPAQEAARDLLNKVEGVQRKGAKGK